MADQFPKHKVHTRLYSEFAFVMLKVHVVSIQIEIRIHFYFFPVQSSSSRNVRHRNSRFSAAIQSVHAQVVIL